MKSTSVRTASAASPAKPVAQPPVKASTKPSAKTATKSIEEAPSPVAEKALKRTAAPVTRKVLVKAAVSPTPPATASPEKPPKPVKVRLVRDSFTMPDVDFALVAVLKARALGLGRAAKKSELLRAGLQLLNQQEPKALVAALERLQPIKTGRPKRGD